MDKIEKIRQEIERHRQAIRVLNEHTTPEQMSKTCTIFQYSDSILSALNSFLDTLSEEPDKSLEEAAKEYEWSNVDTNQLNPPTLDMTVQVGDLRNAFIAGAEWQKEQDMDEWIKDRDGCFWDGVNEGKKAMYEQMKEEQQ
jgi:hypothetical protein